MPPVGRRTLRPTRRLQQTSAMKSCRSGLPCLAFFLLLHYAGAQVIPTGSNRCPVQTVPLVAYTNWTEFTSPGFGQDEYENKLECVWRIMPQVAASQVVVEFLYMDLERTPDGTCNDYVEFFDWAGTSLIDRFCGSERPTVISNGHRLWMHFLTNVRITEKGFKIRYRQTSNVTCPSAVLGGAILNAYNNSAILSSPRYPSDYPQFLQCMWVLKANLSGFIIEVDVKDAHLEDSEGCSSDFVGLFDGETARHPQLARFCAGESPRVYSTGRYLTIVMETDGTGQERGFNLTYRQLHPSARPVEVSVGAVVGGVVGVLAAIVFCGAIIFLIRRDQRQVKEEIRRNSVASFSSYHRPSMSNIWYTKDEEEERRQAAESLSSTDLGSDLDGHRLKVPHPHHGHPHHGHPHHGPGGHRSRSPQCHDHLGSKAASLSGSRPATPTAPPAAPAAPKAPKIATQDEQALSHSRQTDI